MKFSSRQPWLRDLACVLLCVLTAGCTTPLPKNTITPVYPYRSDDCSFAPDLDVGECCRAHDKVYWQGGTCEQRRAADAALRSCIVDKGRPALARVYHAAVRIAGSPLWPLPWRWGFGWPYGMGYSERCE